MKMDLESMLVGKKMEPRYMEYNWRDVALYALAVGAKREDLIYTYEKELKAIPTYGTAVSYTHLDVYKRQLLAHEPENPRSFWSSPFPERVGRYP